MENDVDASAEDFATLEFEETHYEDLERLLVVLRDKYNEREAIRKREREISAEYEALNRNAVRLYNTRGLRSQNLKGIGTFFIRPTIMPTVKQPEALVEWLDNVGDGDLAKRTVHPSTLKSYLNERLGKGEELPSTEIVETFTKEVIAIRRAK
jgi:hypothetical protein